MEIGVVEFLSGGKVVIIRGVDDCCSMIVQEKLFNDLEAKVIIYVTGNSIALIGRPGGSLRMDHPDIRKIIKEAGEEGKWLTNNESGDFFSYNSRRRPADTPSRVNVYELAEVLASWLV